MGVCVEREEERDGEMNEGRILELVVLNGLVQTGV